MEVSLLKEVISKSSLLVTTEIEVYKAVDKWINYNFKKRVKFSNSLLHKVRLPLLAQKTLETILTEKSCFRENKDSLAVVNDILKGNFHFYRNKPTKFFTARYCIHDSFDILYFGGKRKTDKVVDDKIQKIQHPDSYKNTEMVSSLAGKRYCSKVVYLRGNVYIFDGFYGKVDSKSRLKHIVRNIEKYCHLTKLAK